MRQTERVNMVGVEVAQSREDALDIGAQSVDMRRAGCRAACLSVSVKGKIHDAYRPGMIEGDEQPVGVFKRHVFAEAQSVFREERAAEASVTNGV